MNIIKKVVSANQKIAEFWIQSKGWAPENVFEMISECRLDWQVQLSESLELWFVNQDSDAHLILAWANLGALIEGTLKLYLAVYRNDYIKDIDKVTRKGIAIEPDGLALENLKQFFHKKKVLDKNWFMYIESVQQKRNSVHAFKNRDLGSFTDFELAVEKYYLFLKFINNQLPYPDEYQLKV